MLLCLVLQFIYLYAESHYAERHYDECHYAERRYDECRGAGRSVKEIRQHSNEEIDGKVWRNLH
jgi:hypothetical protein